jgi:hypothetical protein
VEVNFSKASTETVTLPRIVIIDARANSVMCE